jgi:hypothetical protein
MDRIELVLYVGTESVYSNSSLLLCGGQGQVLGSLLVGIGEWLHNSVPVVSGQ